MLKLHCASCCALFTAEHKDEAVAAFNGTGPEARWVCGRDGSLVFPKRDACARHKPCASAAIVEAYLHALDKAKQS